LEERAPRTGGFGDRNRGFQNRSRNNW
jgi:hypothetical protein